MLSEVGGQSDGTYEAHCELFTMLVTVGEVFVRAEKRLRAVGPIEGMKAEAVEA
jgi:hypothetical protein